MIRAHLIVSPFYLFIELLYFFVFTEKDRLSSCRRFNGNKKEYCSYYKNDKEVTENLAVDGDMFFCIESLFTETPTKLMCEALEPTYVYAIPRKRLEEVALHNQNIQILYRKILEESLIKSQKHSDMVRFESAQNRYRRICKSAPQVVLRAPLVYIASFLQMTPETLSRVRSSTLID